MDITYLPRLVYECTGIQISVEQNLDGNFLVISGNKYDITSANDNTIKKVLISNIGYSECLEQAFPKEEEKPVIHKSTVQQMKLF